MRSATKYFAQRSAMLLCVAVAVVMLASCELPWNVKPPKIDSTADAIVTVKASLTAVSNSAADLWDLSKETGVVFITADQLETTSREIKRARDLLDLVPPDLSGAQDILRDRKKLLLLILANLPEE